MKWNELKALEQVQQIETESADVHVLIFKHSYRCNISRASLDRLERNWNEVEMKTVKPYFLDLLTYREISNRLAEKFVVEHESPQVLVIRNGSSILNLSHFQINYDQIRETIKN